MFVSAIEVSKVPLTGRMKKAAKFSRLKVTQAFGVHPVATQQKRP